LAATIKGDFVFTIDKLEGELKGAKIPRIIRFTENVFNGLNKLAVENDISYDLLVLQCCKYALENIEEEKTNE